MFRRARKCGSRDGWWTVPDVEAQILATYGVPPALIDPTPQPAAACDCGCQETATRRKLRNIVDELLLRWDPYWPDEWSPWQALVGLLVVAAVWLWNRGVR